VICGGTYRAQDYPDDTEQYYSECFVLVMDNTSGLLEWKEFPGMKSKRAYATSILLEDGSWMILGHGDGDGDVTLKSEIFNISTNSWSYGPEFPFERQMFCAVSIDKTLILWVGEGEGQCFLFNTRDETFKEVACLQSGARHSHSCARTADGRVAVVGGYVKGPEGHWTNITLDTEYFDPITASWSYGAPMPEGIVRSTLVTDGEDLLLLGGSAGGYQPKDTIYRLRDDQWDLLDTKLNTKKMWFPAFPVDASVYNC